MNIAYTIINEPSKFQSSDITTTKVMTNSAVHNLRHITRDSRLGMPRCCKY